MIRLRRGGPIAVGVIFTTILIDFMGYLLLVPILPEHLASLGASAKSHQGLIVALHMFAMVVALPIWGWIADRVGRRPVLLVCLAGTAFAFWLMAQATALPLFYVARLLQGVFGASVGTAQAYISDLTRDEDRARGFGLIGAAGSLGLLIGPALGGVLYGIDPSLLFLAPAALALLAAGAAALFLPESRSSDYGRADLRDLMRSAVPAPIWALFGGHDSRTLLYLYLFFHIFVAFGAVEAMFPNYASVAFGWSSAEVGLFLSYVALVAGVTQGLLIGRLVRVSGEQALVVAGLATASLGMFGLGYAERHPAGHVLLGLGGLALAFGFGATVPTFTSLFSKACADGDESGAYHAHSQAMLNFGRGIGAYAGGMMAEWMSASAPLWFGGVGLSLAFGLYVLLAGVLEPKRKAKLAGSDGGTHSEGMGGGRSLSPLEPASQEKPPALNPSSWRSP